MSEFEFLRNVTVGQYLPTGSAFHRLDPRVKLLMAAIFLAGVVAASSLVGMAIALAAVCMALAIAGISLPYALRGLRPAIPLLIMIASLQVLTIPQNDTGTVLGQWWKITVTTGDLRIAILTLFRFAVLILGLSLFSFSTSTTELAHGVEHLLKPLQRLGLPAHELSLVVVIALRFVPLLAMEVERIAKAQASRGADWGGGRGGVFKRALRMLPLLVPLFIIALQRAETLTLAMEARCYMGGRGRTSLIHLRARWGDLLALTLAALLTVLLLAMSWLNLDMCLWNWIF